MKEMQFRSGVSVKKIPENVRITSVLNGTERLPHRVRDRRIEVKDATFSGVAVIEFEKLRLVHIAEFFPFPEEKPAAVALQKPVAAKPAAPKVRRPDPTMRTHEK